ncbi:MAG TPA: glycoside hydrolase family 44 protein [Ktedonobacteraceae bacterium]|nr:glycoside hydrolase family 44 protein [Ktedonobacteraceae bacterium]
MTSNDISRSSPNGKLGRRGPRVLKGLPSKDRSPQGAPLQQASLSTQGRVGRQRQRRILAIGSVLLLIMLIFAAVRVVQSTSASNDQLLVHIGNQQVVTLDLREALPINPALLGVNIFPPSSTSSKDAASGFMDYSPPLTAGLINAHIKLLRFPGGNWGEQHYLSLDQLSAFSALLQQTDANGMVQARLSGPIGSNFTELTNVTNRANVAGQWVDFLNNAHSDQRIARYARAPYHPVKFWTVGNEPDRLINPATGRTYTVKEYVQDFIQFSTVMHHNDPTIQVFGPEISEFYGAGAGPGDADGQLWMEGFLQGVGAYEKAHNVTLLDGVSFHRYQFANAAQSPYAFLSSAGEWNYLLPVLHRLISQNLGHDLPIAITEINSNPPHQPAPPRGLAALWWADTLGALMNQQVAYVAFSPTEGGRAGGGSGEPYSLFTANGPNSQQPTPMFRVMELFSHLQKNLIPLEAQRDPVSVYATQDDAHNAVSILFINKSPESQLAQVNAESSPFTLNPTSPWNKLDISLAGYSLVVITLHRNGSAEAYSFIAPTDNDATTAEVLHTQCGHKTDPLANDIPC